MRLKGVGLAIVLALMVPMLTACTEGTVVSNTNPKGDPNIECFITIRSNDREGNSTTSKPIQQDAITCKRCPVGSDFPKCKKERSDAEKKAQPPIQNRSPEPPKERENLAVVTVSVSSTHPGIDATIQVYSGQNKIRVTDHIKTDTRDGSKRIPVIIGKDTSITVAARARNKEASVSCEMRIASRVVTGEMAVYQVYCFQQLETL